MKLVLLMKKNPKMNQFMSKLSVGLSLLFFSVCCHADDLLSGAKTDIKSNFGQDSTFIWIIYLIEIILGIITFVKTKNYFALAGIVVVVIFTKFAFAKFAG